MMADRLAKFVAGEAVYLVRPAPAVDEQPSMELKGWRVIEDANRDHHLFGYMDETKRCRMTTAIVDLDLTQRKWITSSGRVYRTHTEPGDPIEEDVRRFLAWHHQLAGPTLDVTDEIWTAMKAAVQ